MASVYFLFLISGIRLCRVRVSISVLVVCRLSWQSVMSVCGNDVRQGFLFFELLSWSVMSDCFCSVVFPSVRRLNVYITVFHVYHLL